MTKEVRCDVCEKILPHPSADRIDRVNQRIEERNARVKPGNRWRAKVKDCPSFLENTQIDHQCRPGIPSPRHPLIAADPTKLTVEYGGKSY